MDAKKKSIVLLNLCLISMQITNLQEYYRARRKNKRRWWVKPHLSVAIRENAGNYKNLFQYFKINDHEEFFQFTRLSVAQFNYIHNLVRPILQKTSNRPSLETELRLAVTLSFLAQGDSAKSTAWNFRIGKSTMYKIIKEVCEAIWKVLQPIYLTCPDSETKWQELANDFHNLWNFPNCLGAIDGKHCRIKAPPNSGSAFHNYKGYFSFVLMAIADARYRFTWVDIGDYGSINDAGIWSNTSLSQALENNSQCLPLASPLPNTNIVMPYVFVGDEGFPLKQYLMRPYSRRNLLGDEQRIFNYRLTRARRIVENAFGILVSRWQILNKPICLKLNTAETVIQAIICLHNFIITSNVNQYIQDGTADREAHNGKIIDGDWRNHVAPTNVINPLGRIGSNFASTAAIKQRNILAQYFISEEGSVPWQWNCI